MFCNHPRLYMFLERFSSQASTSPFKKRMLIVPTSMQTPEEKNAEEDRKAKEAAEAAEKAEEEKKAAAKKEAAKQAFYDMLDKDLPEPVPMTQEEIVHMPNIIYHEYMEITTQEQEQIRQQQEMIVEVPIPMTQEEIVDVHWTLAPAEIEDELFHSVVEVPVPMIQDEFFNSFTLGLPLPRAPKGRVFPLFYQGFSERVVTAIVHQ